VCLGVFIELLRFARFVCSDGTAAPVSRAMESGAPSGPFLVSRTRDAG